MKEREVGIPIDLKKIKKHTKQLHYMVFIWKLTHKN